MIAQANIFVKHFSDKSLVKPTKTDKIENEDSFYIIYMSNPEIKGYFFYKV